MRQWVRHRSGMFVQATAPVLENSIDTTSLVTMPNIELLEVGENWETSTGKFTWDEEDLRSAVAATVDPAVRAPVIKLGHTDPRFNVDKEDGEPPAVQDGQPALGRVLNIRTINNDQTLVGDFVALPQWLAACMYSAYPRRSIEGWFDWTTKTGNTWPFVLTAVALLGEYYPAITTLEDIQALWGSTAPALYPAQPEDDDEYAMASCDQGTLIKARRQTDVKWKGRRAAAAAVTAEVQASASVDDVVRAYYDSLESGQYWWWVRQVLVNPLQLVVDDDDGGLWLIDVTADSEDNITFDEGTQVKVEYVAASGMPTVRQPGQIMAAMYNMATDTGRQVRAAQTDPTPPVEERTMLTDDALRRLGLEPGASEEEINAAILGMNQGGEGGEGDEPETPATPDVAPPAEPETPAAPPAPETPAAPEEPATPTVPEGMVLVDGEQWRQVQEGVAASNALIAHQRNNHRDEVIASAARDGKFPAARIEHYTKMWNADPAGTESLINTMEKGLVPVAARGHDGGVEAAQQQEQSQYPASWHRKVAASKKQTSGTLKVVND